MSLIKTDNLTINYGSNAVLERVNFKIDAGEIVTVLGPNGSGKSTFIRALLGILQPAKGSVHRQKELKIGYVPQKLFIEESLPITVTRFLNLPIKHSAKDTNDTLARVGAAGLENQQMSALSGGQFQRVLLARALLSDPQLLILDEPTQGLDHPGVESFYRLIESVRRDLHCAVLLVSHDLHVVMSASDRVICLNGHVCCEGTPQVVAKDPEYQALFGLAGDPALAIYRHEHDHTHDHDHAHSSDEAH